MFIFKLVLNIVFIGIGIIRIIDAKFELKRNWYPKWVGVVEMILGIAFCIFSFTVWFVK